MSAKKPIIAIVIFSLVSFIILSQGECLAFRRGLKGALEDALRDKGKKSTQKKGDKAAPSAETPSEAGQKPPEERDEFFPGETLDQFRDPETGNTTSLVKMPDGTVKVVVKDPDGNIISQMELSEEDAAKLLSDEEGVITKIARLPDGSMEVRQYDRDGKLISSGALPDASEMTKVSTYDPDTKVMTTSELNEDGSRTVTQTDEDGFMLSQETVSPEEAKLASSSSYDPETGVTTTVQQNPDGSKTVVKSKSWEDEDGTKHTLEVDSEGNQLKTVTAPDGTRTTTLWDAYGNETKVVEANDGTKTIFEKTPDGYLAETTVNNDGTTTTVKRDYAGNVLETVDTHPGGKVTITDSTGVVRQFRTTEDGITRSVTTDKDGNRYELVTDSEGNILHQREIRRTDREPGQEYFETALGGQIGEWDTLPDSLKTRYANSERQARERGERLDLLNTQETERQTQAEEDAAWQAGQMEGMDTELAQIEAERQEHLARRRTLLAQQEVDTAQANLDLARMDAESTSDELQDQLSSALKSGDREEIRRIEDLMDDHHDATAHLYEFTPEEEIQMERYQQARDFAREEIMRSVMADPALSKSAQIARKIGIEGLHDTWAEATLRELTATGVAMDLVEDGAYHSQERAVRANSEIRAAQEYLQRGDLTPYQRQAGEQMLETAISERAHALQGLAADGQVVALGVVFDIGTAAVGGTVARLFGKFARTTVRPTLLRGAKSPPKGPKGRPPTTPKEPPKGPKERPTTPPKEPPKGPKEKPPKPPKEDEPDMQIYDDDGTILTNATLRQRRIAGTELSGALDKYYRYGQEPMDPMHVLNAKNMDKVTRDRRLNTGDINFSAERIGSTRLGGEAIRRRPGSENFIHFIEVDSSGWGVKYFRNGIEYLPDGTVDISKGLNYIPLELLQRFDRQIGRWVDFQ